MKSLLACVLLLGASAALAQGKTINETITIKATPAAMYKSWTTREDIRIFLGA